MSSANSYALSFNKTESLNLSLTYLEDDGVTAISLVGSTAAFIVKDKQGGSTIATLTSGAGITLGGSAGTIVVKRTPEQTAAWKIDKGTYELTVTSSAGDAITLLEGTVELTTT